MDKERKYNDVFKLFFNSYELESSLETSRFKQKSFIDEKSNPQKCRFCLKEFPEVTFKTDAHLIPRFLGSKYLLSNFECDACNSLFKKYENDLATFIGPLRSIVGIKGKSKNPKYSNDKLMIFEEEKNVVRFVSPEIVEKIERGERLIKFETIKNKYIPSNVFKALLKIALSTIKENETSNFAEAFEFLQSDDDDLYNRVSNSMKIFKIFVPGLSIPEFPVIHLFKRKDNIELPEKLMVLHLKNLKFQITLPFNKLDNVLSGKIVDVPMCPVFLSKEYFKKYGDYKHNLIDLSSRNSINNEIENIGIKISNVKKNSS